MTDGTNNLSADRADLATLCLLEIEGLSQIVRGIAESKLEDAAGRAVYGMLLRIERLSDLAALCLIDESDSHVEQVRREIFGKAPASLNAVSSLQREEDATR